MTTTQTKRGLSLGAPQIDAEEFSALKGAPTGVEPQASSQDRSLQRARAHADKAQSVIRALDPHLRKYLEAANVTVLVTDDLKGVAAEFGIRLGNEDAITLTAKNQRTGEMTHVILLSKEACSSPAKALATLTHELYHIENHEHGLMPNSPANRKLDEQKAYSKGIACLERYLQELAKKYGENNSMVKDLTRVIAEERRQAASWR